MCEFFCPSGKGAPNQKKLWGNIACFLYKCSLMTYQRIAPVLMSPLHTPNHTGADEQVRTRCGAAAPEVELVWARTEQFNSSLNGTVDSTSAPQFRWGSERGGLATRLPEFLLALLRISRWNTICQLNVNITLRMNILYSLLINMSYTKNCMLLQKLCGRLELQTSSFKVSESWVWNVQNGEYSQQ